MRLRKRKEEILELIWTLEERGENTVEKLMEISGDPETSEMVKELEQSGFISIEGSKIELKPEGREIAKSIIRRHRLAEVLLMEIFEASNELAHSQACEFEHVLSPEITESICTLLGHPPACPHGKPIPPGECCRRFAREVKPVVVALTELEVGAKAKIVFITPKAGSALDRLTVLGITPGTIVKLQQKKPAFVLRVGETQIALDEEIARSIFVKRVEYEDI